nr:WD40 repeat domain-containing protein [Candidatus Sigynarchaeota archaeon]
MVMDHVHPAKTHCSMEPLSQLTFSPDGRILAVGAKFDGTIRLYEVNSWDLIRVMEVHDQRPWRS